MTGIELEMRVDGVEKVIDNFRKLGKLGVQAVCAAMYAEASNIMLESQRLVPVDLGWLRGSQYVTLPDPKETRPYTELGYAASYAVPVHEAPSNRNWQTPGTGPKYLQRPLNKVRTKLAQQIAKRAKGIIESGKTPNLVPGAVPTTPKNKGPNPKKGKR